MQIGIFGFSSLSDCYVSGTSTSLFAPFFFLLLFCLFLSVLGTFKEAFSYPLVFYWDFAWLSLLLSRLIESLFEMFESSVI